MDWIHPVPRYRVFFATPTHREGRRIGRHGSTDALRG